MNLNVFSADECELGDYRRVVSQIRGNNDLLSDDEEVADEVLAGLD